MDDFERQEAPKFDYEDILQPNDVTPAEEALSQFNAEMPMETPQSPASESLPSQKKLKKKVVLIVLAVVLVLAVVGGVIWFVLAKNIPQSGTDGDIASQLSGSENDNVKQPSDEPKLKNETVELGVDDGLVQKLYGQFTNQGAWFGLLGDGDVNDDILLNVAYSNVKRIYCRGTHDNVPPYHEDHDEASCYDGKAMRDKVYEIFGKTIEINDGYDLLVWYCEGYLYDARHDEFWPSGGGCSGTFTALSRALIRAEKYNDTLYLYEVAAYSKIVAVGREDDYMDWSYQGPIEVRFYQIEKLSDQSYTWYQPGKRIDGLVLTEDQLSPEGRLTTDNYAEMYLREHKDQLDKFKWTFVWNGENYVFEKLEQI